MKLNKPHDCTCNFYLLEGVPQHDAECRHVKNLEERNPKRERNTGRASGFGPIDGGPNPQGIPIQTELGKEIQKAFHKDRGLLIEANFTELELRVLAHMKDKG